MKITMSKEGLIQDHKIFKLLDRRVSMLLVIKRVLIVGLKEMNKSIMTKKWNLIKLKFKKSYKICSKARVLHKKMFLTETICKVTTFNFMAPIMYLDQKVLQRTALSTRSLFGVRNGQTRRKCRELRQTRLNLIIILVSKEVKDLKNDSEICSNIWTNFIISNIHF